jgi:DNA-binding MarR family transcriptional regulator
MPRKSQLDRADQSWGWLLFAHAKVLNALEADLLEEHDLPLIWFDLLNRLRETPEQRMRMNDLKDASLFTKSGITRLIDRIEAAGFVTRVRSSQDRRGVYVEITRAGNDKINQVWPDHVASVWKNYGQFLDAGDMDAIETASRKILADADVPAAVPEA